MNWLIFFRGGGGMASTTQMVVRPLLKKSLDDPYLKIHDFSQLVITDTPIKKKIHYIWLYPLFRGRFGDHVKPLFG